MPADNFRVNTSIRLSNMVSRSCIRLVEMYFERVDGVELEEVILGQAKLHYAPNRITPEELEKQFASIGFNVVQDPDDQLVDDIKVAAIELIHYSYNANSLIRNSDYLSEKLGQSYSKLSKVFSEKTNSTLEKYLILLKIEKVKELLMGEDYTLSEIAYMLGYSSVQYLSNQFKKTTGITVSEFKQDPIPYRIPLDDLLK